MSIYDFNVTSISEKEISMEQYKGKVLLIVNTAIGCVFTPQYDFLQDLYEEYQSQGLEILDFPCNQFNEQAPGSNADIHGFCTGRFGVTFQQFAKIDVNGENAEPLYKWLKEQPVKNVMSMKERLSFNKLFKKNNSDEIENDIEWNFTKFLVDRDGKVVERFAPNVDVKKIEESVKALL